MTGKFKASKPNTTATSKTMGWCRQQQHHTASCRLHFAVPMWRDTSHCLSSSPHLGVHDSAAIGLKGLAADIRGILTGQEYIAGGDLAGLPRPAHGSFRLPGLDLLLQVTLQAVRQCRSVVTCMVGRHKAAMATSTASTPVCSWTRCHLAGGTLLLPQLAQPTTHHDHE